MAAETSQTPEADDLIAISEAMAAAQAVLYKHGVEFERYRLEVQMTEGGDSVENPLRRTGRRYAVTRRPVEGKPGSHEMLFCPINPDGTPIQ